jgi:hypothetical protein
MCTFYYGRMNGERKGERKREKETEKSGTNLDLSTHLVAETRMELEGVQAIFLPRTGEGRC